MFRFINIEKLTDGELDLYLYEKLAGNFELSYLPSYVFRITKHGSRETVGSIDLRIGHNENSWYAGNIGYNIDEEYRGNHYAEKACRIVQYIAYIHGMRSIIITADPDNLASRRTCERLGCTMVCITDVPCYSDLFHRGEKMKCIYRWEFVKTSGHQITN